MARLARGVVTADLPWGVFLIAAGTSYLLLSVVFRYGAARTGSETADVVIAYRGKRPACGCCATRATRSVTL